jgi:hypothetical protein
MRLEARESGSPAAWPTLTNDRYEAIVVGSGFGGAVAAAAWPRRASASPYSNAAGTFRISLPGVAHLLGSMRPVPVGRTRDAALALRRFVGFYARTIVGRYAAGRRAARH